MKQFLFYDWCWSATRLIRFPPDRRAVYKELMNHLEDHRDALMEQGMDAEAAQQAAVDAMGSSTELAKVLAQIHRPFWGYMLRVTRVLTAVFVSLALIGTVIYAGNLKRFYDAQQEQTKFLSPEPVGKWMLLKAYDTHASTYWDGYWLSVSDARLWGYPEYKKDLFFRLNILYLPAQGGIDDFSHFWAVDDQGNYYSSSYEQSMHISDLRSISLGPVLYSTGGAVSYRMNIHDIPSDNLQWIDLHYDRDGRNMVLRIDLTGGETP